MATSPHNESPVADEEEYLGGGYEDGHEDFGGAAEPELGGEAEHGYAPYEGADDDGEEAEEHYQGEEEEGDELEDGEEADRGVEDDGSEEEGHAGGSFQSADDEDDDFDLPQDLAPGAGAGAGEDEEDFQGQHASSSSGALPPGLNDGDGAGTERWNLRKDGNKEELEAIWSRLSTDREHTKISKMFSYVLRHAAHKLGVTIRKDGFVRLREIMKLRNFKPYNLEELMAAVYFDEKERYTMVREFDGELLIRANQGHTMKVVEDDLLLQIITDPSEVQECVHGTYLVHWPFIKRQGISKVARNHIHLANGLPEDGKIRGMRSTAELFVYVDVPLAMEDGIVFYRSKNDVILTQGYDGWLPVKFFQKAVRIDYNTCDIEELEFDCEGVPIPEWPAELAPSGPGEQGTYLIKNLEALISNCRKRLQEINELRALQDRGDELDDEELEKIGKYAQVYTELQSLEQRFRQHKGYRRESVQEKENRAKEQAEATTVVKRKDRALTPPWDKGKSHLESVGMKSTEKEKAEWAALGRRRDNATPTASNVSKKEDQWSLLGRGRNTPAAAKRDDSTKRGGKSAKARGADFPQGGPAGRDREEENWRSGRAEPKKQAGKPVAAEEASSKAAANSGGPPRIFNSKKSMEGPSWRDRMTNPRQSEDRQTTPEQAVERVNSEDVPSWRSQMSGEDRPSWRTQMTQPLSEPPQQPPTPSWHDGPSPQPGLPPTPSWREQMLQQPMQQPRTDGPQRRDRMAPAPLQGDMGSRRDPMMHMMSQDEFPSAVPPPPSTPAPMSMPPMVPNPVVANAPQTPAGGGTPGMMQSTMQSQVRGFGPPSGGPGEGGMPPMMSNPLVGTAPPQGGSGPGMMPPSPSGNMQGMMPQSPPSRGGGLGMQGGPRGMQGGLPMQGGMQGGGGMQAMGSMQPGPGMQQGGGMQVGMQQGGGMPGEAGMGRFMAVPMWQGQQMQGGQVCTYGPSGQGQPQLFCTPGTGGQSQQGGGNFGTSAPGQSPGGAGGSWLRQAQFMSQQGQQQGQQQGFDQGGPSMMQQPGSPQGSMGMQQAMASSNFSQGFGPGGDQRGQQQGQGPCFGYGGNQQTQRPGLGGFDGRQGPAQQPPQHQAFGYGGGFGGGSSSPGGKGGDSGQGMRTPGGRLSYDGGGQMGGGYGYGGQQQQPPFQGGDGRGAPMQQQTGPRGRSGSGAGFQDSTQGKGGGGWAPQGRGGGFDTPGYDDDGGYAGPQQGPRGGRGGGRRGDGQWEREEASWGYGDYDGGDGYGDYDMGEEDARGQWRKGGGGGRGKDGGGKGGKKGGKGGGGKGGGGKAAGKASRDRDDAQDWAAIGRRRQAA